MRDNLRKQCRQVKHSLSGGGRSGDITLLNYYKGSTVQVPLSREDFLRLTNPFVQNAVRFFSETLRQAGLDPSGEEIDQVLLIGGSSRLAGVFEALQSQYPRIHIPDYPEWAVSQGASDLAGNPGSYQIMQRICLETADGSLLDLVGPGDRFNGSHKAFLLGVTTRTDVAQLAFWESQQTDGDRRVVSRRMAPVGTLSVPLQEFLEDLDLRCQLTQDLTVRVLCKGVKGGSEDVGCWEYEGVRFVYSTEGRP